MWSSESSSLVFQTFVYTYFSHKHLKISPLKLWSRWIVLIGNILNFDNMGLNNHVNISHLTNIVKIFINQTIWKPDPLPPLLRSTKEIIYWKKIKKNFLRWSLIPYKNNLKSQIQFSTEINYISHYSAQYFCCYFFYSDLYLLVSF